MAMSKQLLILSVACLWASSLLAQEASPPLEPSSRIQRSILENPPPAIKVVEVDVVAPTAEPAKLDTSLQSTPPRLPTAEKFEIDGTGELVSQRYPNGLIQIERWVVEDSLGNLVNHGSFTEFDTQGQRTTVGQYTMGKREGSWTKQLSAAQAQQLSGMVDKAFSAPFQSKVNFSDDQIDGEWTLEDSQGKLIFSWNMRRGMRTGPSAWYSPQSEVVQLITYVENIPHGTAKVALPEETAAQERTFTQGMILRRIDKWFPENGDVAKRTLQAQEWQLTPSTFNIISHDWDESRVNFQQPNPADAVRHGMSVTFYRSGQREWEGNYVMGRKNGLFAWWHSNGQQSSVGEYRDDVEHSSWTWWHENGMKKATGKYIEGKKISEWSIWDATGQLVQRTLPENAQVAERDDAPALQR